VATGGWTPHEPLTTPIPIDRLLTTPAKVLASALWVSGRSQEDALAHSAFIGDGISTASTRITDLVQVSVDEPAKTVTMTLELTEETVPEIVAGYREMYPSLQADWEDESRRLLALGAVSRSARAAGSQGCHIVPVDGAGPFFEPVEVTSALPPADTLDWPMGDILSSAPNSGPWGAVTDAAFADPDAHTAAFVVLHKGQVVCERCKCSRPLCVFFRSLKQRLHRRGRHRPGHPAGELEHGKIGHRHDGGPAHAAGGDLGRPRRAASDRGVEGRRAQRNPHARHPPGESHADACGGHNSKRRS